MTFAKLSNKSSAKQSHLVQYENCFPVFPHGPYGCFIRTYTKLIESVPK